MRPKSTPNSPVKEGIILFDAEDYTRQTGKHLSQEPDFAKTNPAEKPRSTSVACRRQNFSWAQMPRRSSFRSFKKAQDSSLLSSSYEPIMIDCEPNFRDSLAHTVLVHEDIPMLEETYNEVTTKKRRSSRIARFWRKYICRR